MTRLTDYHAHTPRCHHAAGPMNAYVEEAIDQGLSEFGFSDHSPWMLKDANGRKLAMNPGELGDYVSDVHQLQEVYHKDGPDSFRVRLGLEMDWVPSRLDLARQVTEDYPWDYLIGSVHHLGFWSLPSHQAAHQYEQYDAREICELYYYQVGQMIQAGFCDIIGHLDVIRKHGFDPGNNHMEWIEPLIRLIRDQGTAVEINTSGVDAPLGQVHPDREIIGALNDSGVPLCLNSDSHHPNQVARHFNETLSCLKKEGVKELVRFEKRKATGYSI
jgi:histidinol-phosphatase (PHP family)